MPFSENLLGATSHNALICRHDSELEFLCLTRQYIVNRIKTEFEYSKSLTALTEGILHKANGLQLSSGLYQLWHLFLEKTIEFADQIRRNIEHISNETLASLSSIIAEKKATKKHYQNERQRIETEFVKVHEDVVRARSDYVKLLDKARIDRLKVENVQQLNKTNRSNSKSDDSRHRFLKTSMRLHNAHNHYILSIREANNHSAVVHEKLIPGLMEYQEQLMISDSKASKGILAETIEYFSHCQEVFQAMQRNLNNTVASVVPGAEYVDFERSCKSAAPQSSRLEFEINLQHCYEGKLRPDSLSLDSFTWDSLSLTRKGLEFRAKELETRIVALTQELRSAERDPNRIRGAAALRLEALEARCRLEKTVRILSELSSVIGLHEGRDPPPGLDDLDTSAFMASRNSRSNSVDHLAGASDESPSGSNGVGFLRLHKLSRSLQRRLHRRSQQPSSMNNSTGVSAAARRSGPLGSVSSLSGFSSSSSSRRQRERSASEANSRPLSQAIDLTQPLVLTNANIASAAAAVSQNTTAALVSSQVVVVPPPSTMILPPIDSTIVSPDFMEPSQDLAFSAPTVVEVVTSSQQRCANEYLDDPVSAAKRDIQKEVWFHGVLPRDDVQRLLVDDGDFLVRESHHSKHVNDRHMVLSVMWQGHKHFIIQGEPGQWRFEKRSYPTIAQLIEEQLNSREPVTAKSGALLMQPVPRCDWQLNNDDVVLEQEIGKGNFGTVFKGSYNGQEVAVKTCKEVLSDDLRAKFLQEGKTLLHYKHPNIVRLIGIAAQRQPIMIVMEYVPYGALLTFLKKNRDQVGSRDLGLKLRMCIDAAAGMAYLESRNCIHRDLAARNCLVGRNNVIKIGDFGMSREEEVYEVSGGLKQIPIKWTAIEALNTAKYTSRADVWSFGVLMWEIFSDGATPYAGLTNPQTRDKVEAGYRMPAPDGTPESIYQLMLRCWLAEPEQRPSFRILQELLQHLHANAFDRVAEVDQTFV